MLQGIWLLLAAFKVLDCWCWVYDISLLTGLFSFGIMFSNLVALFLLQIFQLTSIPFCFFIFLPLFIISSPYMRPL